MGILENTRKPRPAASGRWIMIPRQPAAQGRRRTRIIRRRRQTFLRLLSVAGATLVLGLIPPLRWLLLANLAADLMVGVYVWRLLEWKKREAERARKVTLIEADSPQPIAQSG
ncbi:MAG: hypothetical protein ABR548_14200 [Actinomycetota bacterium]|nr:hypothetical protein [Actinomycetota bacterium]